jgi:glycosyltransferase involved in cell wall biosynthesis
MFARGLYRQLCQILETQPHTVVYVYSLNIVFEGVMARLKRRYGKKFHYCLVIPDLPGKYGIVRRGIKGLKDRLETKPKMHLAAKADSYIFLTEAMKKLFPPKPSAVLEGFLPRGEFDYQKRRIPKTVLYTGSLNREFGLGNLLEAFRSIPDPEA